MYKISEKGDTIMALEPEKLKITKTEYKEISIPENYFKELDFKEEALVEVSNSTLIIRPTKEVEYVDLSEYILKDLIDEGYTGNELLVKFKEIKEGIPFAINNMAEEALANKALTHDMNFDKFFEEVEDE